MRYLLLIAAAGGLSAQMIPPEAAQAHLNGDLKREREILEGAASSGNAEDRAAAERRLAWLEWRFYKVDDAAREHFNRAEALKASLSVTLAQRARFETARGRYKEARRLARLALKSAGNPRDRNDARYAYALATVEEAFDTGKTADAGEALELATEAVRAEPGRMAPSRAMYGLALVKGDTARAEEAVRSYFWGGPTSQIYPEAGLAANAGDVAVFARFCRRVQSIADEHYRRVAIGESKAAHTVLKQPVLAEARRLWPHIESEDALRRHLEARFNVDLAFHNFGMTLGGRARSETVTLEQYGRKTRVSFVVLDPMVCNGYVTWLSDGAALIGGWAGPPMVQIRRDDALRAWASVTEADAIKKLNERITAAAATDDRIARTRPLAYMESLSLRFYRRAQRELLAELESRGLTGAELRLAFLYEFEQRHRSCIAAHEARHLIDRELGTAGNRELTAALSQVLFGSDALLCQAGILGPNIGRRDNGTSEANMLILDAVSRWMEAHSGEIEGLDRTRPALSQFDLLTREQIREAFRSMDPLAGGVLPKWPE